MTGNLLLDSLISLAAIAVMVAVSWAAFRAPAPVVNEAAARERLAFDEPDFVAVAWVFDDAGRAALAQGKGGDFALVSRLGADLVTRRFAGGTVKAVLREGALVVTPGDPGARPVRISAPEAPEWARKISVV